MNRSSLPLGVMALYKYWTSSEQTLRCSLSFQRNSGMWNLITKSSLVASVLSDSFIPAVVFLKDKVGTSDKGKDICRYEILDGQQRLTSLFEFLDDRWALHGSIEPIEFDGFTYDIAGKKFSELEPELQDAIKGYRFSIQALRKTPSFPATCLLMMSPLRTLTIMWYPRTRRPQMTAIWIVRMVRG